MSSKMERLRRCERRGDGSNLLSDNFLGVVSVGKVSRTLRTNKQGVAFFDGAALHARHILRLVGRNTISGDFDEPVFKFAHGVRLVTVSASPLMF